MPTFTDLPTYIYGAGDVGLPGNDYANDRELIRIVAENNNWLHASPDYGGGVAGGTFKFLRKACDDLGVKPKMILKLFIAGYDSGAPATTDDPVRNVHETLEVLGKDQIEIAQIWGSDRFYDDIREGGPISTALQQLRADGLVAKYAFQLDSGVSADQWALIQDIVDGYMMYLNAVERDASNEVSGLLQQSGAEVISLRALARIFVEYETWDAETTPMPNYTHPDTRQRVEDLKRIYERSGCKDWVEFNMSFRRAFPNVVSTIGMTTKPPHLNRYLEADKETQPMQYDLAADISALQEKWYA
ncbi:MAG: hypothetical protein QF437_16715 [Planctomycetota bacterium]|jgi:hypothetical protein|nr:hypothetical protein [Planctomycetota bacterium]MDP7132141.1 hypothetical protein [Planctomycetota bacterium]